MPRLIIKKGYKNFKLTVLKEIDPQISNSGIKLRKVLCLCECGNRTTTIYYDLKRGKRKSCGCLRSQKRPKSMTHGMSNTKFYSIFRGIQSRCKNKKNKAYRRYGGRDIKCEWKNFEDFKWDMYKKYVSHIKKYGEKQTTIDRKNNNGNYCRSNCRWATHKEQGNNRSTNRLITYRHTTLTMAQWAEKIGVKETTLSGRINTSNMTDKEALTKPLQIHRRK